MAGVASDVVVGKVLDTSPQRFSIPKKQLWNALEREHVVLEMSPQAAVAARLDIFVGVGSPAGQGLPHMSD